MVLPLVSETVSRVAEVISAGVADDLPTQKIAENAILAMGVPARRIGETPARIRAAEITDDPVLQDRIAQALADTEAAILLHDGARIAALETAARIAIEQWRRAGSVPWPLTEAMNSLYAIVEKVEEH